MVGISSGASRKPRATLHSSAEAELYAMAATASEGLGAKAMCSDFGTPMEVYLHVDASAAIGFAQRTGLGTIRHLDTQSLWIQDAVRHKRVSLLKIPGTENPADLMTKPLESATQDKLMSKLGLVVLDGRAASAPMLTSSFTGSPVESDEQQLDVEVSSLDVLVDTVCIDQRNIADGITLEFDKVSIGQENIADGLISGDDKVCIDQDNIAIVFYSERIGEDSGMICIHVLSIVYLFLSMLCCVAGALCEESSTGARNRPQEGAGGATEHESE